MTTLTSTISKTVPFRQLADRIDPALPIVGRTFLASLFLLSGVNKIGAYEMTQGYMAAFGLPGGLLPLVIGFEIVAALALIAGPFVRLAALALAGFALSSAFIFHANFADPGEVTHLLKNIAIAGGLLLAVRSIRSN